MSQTDTHGIKTRHKVRRLIIDILMRCLGPGVCVTSGTDVTMSRCHEPGARLITFSFGVIQTHFPIPISAPARAARIMLPLGACALSPARQAVIKVLCRGKH